MADRNLIAKSRRNYAYKPTQNRDTWTSIRNASRTLSLLIRAPSLGRGVELGVRDGGGVGGGKG